MAGPKDDPYLKELGRRALEELLGVESARRYFEGGDSGGPDEDAFDDDVFDESAYEPVPDPVLADFFTGASLRALSAARDGLEEAKAAYEQAVLQARTAGWTWAEVARVLGVSKQSVHNRFRDRDPR